MKKITSTGLILMFSGILFFGCAGTRAIAQGAGYLPVTYQTFYDDLSPFGTWIDYPPFVSFWHPDIARDLLQSKVIFYPFYK